ncbi:MAG: hypothetical protein HYV26_23230, partial [Candidatus Hydrogenedentes bacterium]|nr:hypothetical protein [Candidatus Hydrogenedentota bacterium]
RTLEVNLYYTGLGDVAHIAERGDPATEYALARDFTTHLTAHVPANGFTWFVIR